MMDVKLVVLKYHLLVLAGTSSHLQACPMQSGYLNERVLHSRNSLPSVSYIKKSDFVKLNNYSDLGFINHLKVLSISDFCYCISGKGSCYVSVCFTLLILQPVSPYWLNYSWPIISHLAQMKGIFHL